MIGHLAVLKIRQQCRKTQKRTERKDIQTSLGNGSGKVLIAPSGDERHEIYDDMQSNNAEQKKGFN
jgi:hypothetical protein